MSTETEHGSPSPRRFGTGAVVAAAIAAAIVAGGGTYLAGHRHAGTEPTAAAPVVERWQCPMHPSIVQDHPGDCPICGMKLVRVALGAAVGGETASVPAGSATTAAAPASDRWQCPMHPSVVQDHPGDCPICGMRLVKLEGGRADVGATSPGPEGLSAVTIDPARQQLIGLRIAHVERGPVGGAWRTSGRIAIDETRVHHVNVKFSGFMEKVYGDFVGRAVKRGEPLFSIYSPELLAAQEELLLALRTRGTLAEKGALAADGDTLVAAARRKLELWDVPAAEVARVERTGQASRTITFSSPATGVITKKDVVPGMRVNAGDMPFEIVDLSRVWVLADAYEADLAQVKIGTEAILSLKAVPNRTFTGRVAFVDPFLDPKTRTAKVRIDFPNPRGELKPEMFGEVILRGASRRGVRIPADAVIRTGTQSVVFVALPDGKFQPREVTLGPGDAQFVEVLSGLEPGDGVVTRANFLVDSESRLRASLSALPGGAPAAASPAGHADTGEDAKAPAADPHAAHRR